MNNHNTVLQRNYKFKFNFNFNHYHSEDPVFIDAPTISAAIEKFQALYSDKWASVELRIVREGKQ